MSDHGENGSNSGYDTPVPELDDHRQRGSSVQRSDRPRRGTFDSLYGAHHDQVDQLVEHPGSTIRVRDFEEAVIDEDAPDASPTAYRSRRPTVATVDPRSISPPNSVKAFAEARRRERGHSFSDTKGDKVEDEPELIRAASVASRHSHRSRPYTIENDAVSLVTNRSAEDDVCFPMQDERGDDNLHIDFDYLENFMREEEEQRMTARHASVTRVFPDLRPDLPHTASAPAEMVTSDGDFVKVPTHCSGQDEKQPEERAESLKAPQQDHNRFSFFSSTWESTIHAADFADLVLPGESIRGLFTLPKGETDGVWWLNISNPAEEEVRAICRAFGVHPLTIEDITTQESREKIELFPSYYFACFRSFNTVVSPDEVEYEPFHMYVVVFREGTLSFSFAPNSHASKVRARIAMLKDYVALSSDWVCYALIDNIVDSFSPVIHKVELDSEIIEDEVFIARSDDMHQFLRRIGNNRRNVNSLMRLLGGKADVLKGFTKRCNENYKVTPRMDIGMYLGDIQDHVVTMMNNLGHCEKMLTRAHSNYLAQLSIDSITQGTDTNRALSKMTLLASIIVPLNVVTGIFGMNVKVPYYVGDDPNATLIPFFVILAGLIGFSCVCVLIAKRLRWI